MASLIIGIRIPVGYEARIIIYLYGYLPIAVERDMMVVTNIVICGITLITSTNFIMGTGFIKCMPMTFPWSCSH